MTSKYLLSGLAFVCALGGMPAAFGQPMLFDSDAPRELMFDKSKQKLLDKKAYLQNAAVLRQKLEAVISTKTSSPEAIKDARRGLISIDPLFKDTAKNDPVAAELERSDFVESQHVLLEYYKRTNNDAAVLRVLKRLADLTKASAYPGNACVTLLEIGDIYYSLHQLSEAEQYYKDAVALAVKTAVAPKAIPGYVAGVTPGPAKTGGSIDVSPFEHYAYFLALQNRLKEACFYADKALDYYLPSGEKPVFCGDDTYGFYTQFINLIKGKDAKCSEHFAARFKRLTAPMPYSGLLGADGKELTPPTFSFVSKFSEGLAAARDRKTWRVGYINNSGAWVIPPRYLAAEPFVLGLAPVKIPTGKKLFELDGRDDNFSLINKEGKVVAQLGFPSIISFDGVVAFCTRQAGMASIPSHIVDKTGEVLFDALTMQPVALGNERFYLPVTTGQKLEGCCVTSLGYVLKFAVEADNSRPGHYKLVQMETPGTAGGALKPDTDLMQSKLLTGNLKTPPSYDHIVDARELGLYVKDAHGKRISAYYSNISPMQNGDFLVFDSNMNRGIVASDGKQIVKPDYQDVRHFCDGRAAVMNHGLWGFVDRSGKVTTPLKYKSVTDFTGGVAVYARQDL